MARVFGPGTYQAAAQAEGLTAAQARAARDRLAEFLPSMVDWLKTDPTADGRDEAGWRAAWPFLAGRDDAAVRFVMRVVAERAGGDFAP